MRSESRFPLAIDVGHIRAGLRVAVAVSGGADSVALLRLLAEASDKLGIVVSSVHVHHGIRGEEADRDASFTESLARELGVSFLRRDADAPARAAAHHEGLEEAARNLRYEWFRELLSAGQVNAVATAHTLDDQAETVLHKLLRGAWTEGLGGIHPVLNLPQGTILRPLLAVRRSEIEAWLRELGQDWCEDSTNRDPAYTRNRIRHHLLPELATYNPQIAKQMSSLAAIARDEEHYWHTELERILPSLLLPGRAVRGGGRATSTHPEEGSVAMEIERLRLLHPALRRRVVRAAAKQLGHSLDFDQTARVLAMCGFDDGGHAKRETLSGQLHAERTARELRLVRNSGAAGPLNAQTNARPARLPEYSVAVPGETVAEAFRLRVLVAAPNSLPAATLRTPRAGDRVQLRYTSAPKPLKEVFERLRVPAEERPSWPLLEWQGQIVWMRGAEVENLSPLTVREGPFSADGKIYD